MGEWYVACLARYLPVLGTGYVVACAVDPVSGLPFWRGFGTQLGDFAGLLPLQGAVALFLLLLLWLLRRHGSTGAFRAWACVLTIAPLVPVWLGGAGGVVGIMMLTHLVFALWIMPSPELLEG
ncbi:hypothetical protein [Streptomyces sp. NPDC002952]|uniref:hypothetical protein n=1 Tax=Streptomyces sp. NPDC002952 TaxID=3364673 RepID=UPI00367954F1